MVVGAEVEVVMVGVEVVGVVKEVDWVEEEVVEVGEGVVGVEVEIVVGLSCRRFASRRRLRFICRASFRRLISWRRLLLLMLLLLL